jgi:hypothetical protein
MNAYCHCVTTEVFKSYGVVRSGGNDGLDGLDGISGNNGKHAVSHQHQAYWLPNGTIPKLAQPRSPQIIPIPWDADYYLTNLNCISKNIAGTKLGCGL